MYGHFSSYPYNALTDTFSVLCSLLAGWLAVERRLFTEFIIIRQPIPHCNHANEENFPQVSLSFHSFHSPSAGMAEKSTNERACWIEWMNARNGNKRVPCDSNAWRYNKHVTGGMWFDSNTHQINSRRAAYTSMCDYTRHIAAAHFFCIYYSPILMENVFKLEEVQE